MLSHILYIIIHENKILRHVSVLCLDKRLHMMPMIRSILLDSDQPDISGYYL